MGNDVTWWNQNRKDTPPQNEASAPEAPGDTRAPDIVGRTGEEMPEVAHDEVDEPPDPKRPTSDEEGTD